MPAHAIDFIDSSSQCMAHSRGRPIRTDHFVPGNNVYARKRDLHFCPCGATTDDCLAQAESIVCPGQLQTGLGQRGYPLPEAMVGKPLRSANR